MKIKIDLPPGKRLETGRLVINDDWPGVFIRGDNAIGYAILLKTLLDKDDSDAILKAQLKSLCNLLFSAEERNEDRN